MGGRVVFALLILAAVAVPSPGRDWTGRARVDGRVVDSGDHPVSGATVRAERPTGEEGPRVTTDAEGRWVLDGVGPGSWTITVDAPGHLAARIGVHLPDESSWLGPVEVRVERERPTPPPANRDPSPVVEGSGDAGLPREGAAAPTERVRAALAAGRIDRAGKLASALEPEDPVSREVLVETGTALLVAGDTVGAVECLSRVVEGHPRHAEARYRRALGLLGLGRPVDARRDFEALLEMEGASPFAEKARHALGELSRIGE